LGKLHRVSDQKKLPPFLRPHNQVGFGTEEIAQYVLSTQCPADFKQHFHKVFPQGIVELSGQDFPHGLIHGDFYFDNAIFRNGFLASMLDFEQSGIGPFIFDIGVSISGSCLKESKIFMPYVQNFIDGYHSERKLLEKELIHLNKFICLGLFSIALWRIKRFTEGILDPTKKDSYKELTTRALNFKTS
jgi:homoserine kinase type II